MQTTGIIGDIRPGGEEGRQLHHFHQDELARLDDIESLMTTARDLVARFKAFEMQETATSIQTAISTIRLARSRIIDRTRGA